MRQKTFLEKKLRNYSVLAGSALAAGTVHAQIVYHPVNIVLSSAGGSYAIDLNGDGTTDFDVKQNNNSRNTRNYAEMDFGAPSGTHYYNVNAALAGTIQKTGVSNSFVFGLPYPYSSGKKIGASNKWFGYEDLKSSDGGAYHHPILAELGFRGRHGNWSEVSKKYVALKLMANGQVHYGWLRLSVGFKGDSVTIFGYAYQSIPDSPIIAGEGVTTEISAQPQQKFLVYSSDKNVFVKYPGAQHGITIVVTDMLGKEVKSIQTTDELYEFNLTDAAPGIYTVTVRGKEGESTRKVSIQ